ncbi:MAG: DUF3306 domain-containing protein [Polaromonas sp.]|nr:DUF3306 domain-containing protein [Polaromonas sp.]
MAEEPSGFLGRWARRKTDVLQGKAVDEPAVMLVNPVQADPSANQIKPVEENLAEKPPALSLEDVRLLTKDSDFKPFMAQSVGVDVRNAAMKKLFTDPHFNVMDGLDIYIDDYSKADPIPEAMLRAMNGSKFLKLFDDEEDDSEAEKQSVNEPRHNAAKFEEQSLAQSPVDSQQIDPVSDPQINSSQPESPIDSETSQIRHPSSHDHSHLRLQPDHAITGPEAGCGDQ